MQAVFASLTQSGMFFAFYEGYTLSLQKPESFRAKASEGQVVA